MRSTLTAEFYDVDGLIYFKMSRSSIADVSSVPFEFDGPATVQHIAGYKPQWELFQKQRTKERELEETEKIVVFEMEKATILPDKVQSLEEMPSVPESSLDIV